LQKCLNFRLRTTRVTDTYVLRRIVLVVQGLKFELIQRYKILRIYVSQLLPVSQCQKVNRVEAIFFICIEKGFLIKKQLKTCIFSLALGPVKVRIFLLRHKHRKIGKLTSKQKTFNSRQEYFEFFRCFLPNKSWCC